MASSPSREPCPKSEDRPPTSRTTLAADLHAAWTKVARAATEFGVREAEFTDGLWTRLLARLARSAVTPDASRLRPLIASAHSEDLLLVLAADAGSELAWTRIVHDFSPRLAALAQKRGASAADAEALAIDVFGDLSRRTASGAFKTGLGAYEGSADLFSWLAVILLRRKADLARDRKASRMNVDEAPAENAIASGAGTDEVLATGEIVKLAASVIHASYAEMTPAEALALKATCQDGLSQRSLAMLLGISQPQVSRLLRGALERLRHNLRRADVGVEILDDFTLTSTAHATPFFAEETIDGRRSA